MGRTALPSLAAVLLVGLVAVPASGATEPDQVLLPDGEVLDGTFMAEYVPDRFGAYVAISNDTLVVGYSKKGPPPPEPFDEEYLHIYERTGDSWVETDRLVEPFPGFGGSSDIDGDWIVVGSVERETDGVNCGAVDVYRQVDRNWSKVQTLLPDVCNEHQNFGGGLSLDGGRLLITDRNSVYLYQSDGSRWTLLDKVAEIGELTQAADLRDDRAAVIWTAFSDTPDVGDHGVLVFELANGQFSEEPVFLDPSGDDPSLGCQDVEIAATRIAVGCPWALHDPAFLLHGAVFVFSELNGSWVESDVITPSNGFGDFDQFGHAVEMDADTLLIGAPEWTTDSGETVGAAYLYKLLDGEWNLSAFSRGAGPCGLAATSFLGRSLAMEGETYAVGETGYCRAGRANIYGASSGAFADDDDSTFESDIEWLASEGITKGCNPPTNDLYCPDDPVTRGQMAAFLVRALGYADDGGGDLFVDDDDSTFEADIDKLGTAGVTKGCNPPVNDRFCPDAFVTRGQMAAFLVRALGYADDGGRDLFVDDDGSTFENDIDKLGTAGVTRGCNPPDNTEFCPDDFVTRGQMAAFLHRALGS